MAILEDNIHTKLKLIFNKRAKEATLVKTYDDAHIRAAAQSVEDEVTKRTTDFYASIERVVPGIFTDEEKRWILALVLRYNYKRELAWPRDISRW